MQKLKFINGNGVEIDLTDKVNFGIIAWEGFSADGLNIQSQQVPFQDGGVFLDALMEQRELSVTVAINAKGDLEKRYRLRRELISVLNPKLGEGVLIYTDNYLSKQIHVIPQIPLFDTNNSNDSGTPKVSCSFTACNPYWEDLEDTVVFITPLEQPTIENTGDVPAPVEIECFTEGVNYPTIKNVTTNKKIEYNGELKNNLYISTKLGEKQVLSYEKRILDYLNYTLINDNIYIEDIKKFIKIGNNGLLQVSDDGLLWTVEIDYFENSVTSEKSYYILNNLKAIEYSPELKRIVIVGENVILVSYQNSYTKWTLIERTESFNDIAYGTFQSGNSVYNHFIAVGNNGVVLLSSDAITWTVKDLQVSGNVNEVVFVKMLGARYTTNNQERVVNQFMISYNSSSIFLYNSVDNTKTNIEYGYNDFIGLFYSEVLNTVLMSVIDINSYTLLYNATSGRYETGYVDTIYRFIATFMELKNKKILMAITYNGGIVKSTNGMDWERVSADISVGEEQYYICCASESLSYFTINYLNRSFITSDCETVESDTNLTAEETEEGTYYGIIKQAVYIKDYTYFILDGDIYEIDINKKCKKINKPFTIISMTTYGDNLVVLNGDQKKIALKTPNQTEWTILNVPYSIDRLAYDEKNNLYYGYRITYMASSIYRSTDLINWEQISLGRSIRIYKLIITNSFQTVYYIMGSSSSANVVLSSTNLTNWYTRLTLSSEVEVYDIAYIDRFEKVFVLAESGNLYEARLNENLTLHNLGVSNDLRSIAYIMNEDALLLVGSGGLCLKSKDGVTWGSVYKKDIYNFYYVMYQETLNETFVFGDNSYIDITEYYRNKNVIDKMSADTDMNFNLDVGGNKIMINFTSGNVIIRIKFRKKYIGV